MTLNKVSIISNGKAGREHPIRLEVLLQYRTIKDALLYVTLSPSQNIPISTHAQELNYFTVNSDRYNPSNKYNSVNKIYGVGSNNSLIANGVNIFTFDWITSFFQPIIPDGIISAWLEINGEPLIPFIPSIIPSTVQNELDKARDYFKENTPTAIAILAFVAIIIIGLLYFANRFRLPIIETKLPKTIQLKRSLKRLERKYK